MENPSRPRLPAGLYALCDNTVHPELPPARKALALLEGGVRVMQLRLKGVDDRSALQAAREVVAACRRAGALCLVNDRVDWALVAQADGVHLGDEDLPPSQARRLLGPDKLIGVTARDARAIHEAKAAGADYVGVGPVFATQTKNVGRAPLGLEGLAALVRQAPLPVVAIAGIDASNIAAVADAGAHGAAVAGALYRDGSIPHAARALAAAFAQGRRP